MNDLIKKIKSKITYDSGKELIWIVIGQAFTIFISFFIMKYLTKMGVSDFGKYSLTLSIAAFFSSILYGPVEQGILRFYHEHLNNGTSKSFLRIYNKFLLLISVIILIVGLIYFLINSINKDYLEILTISLYIIFFSTTLSYNSILNLLRKRKLNAFLQVFEKITIFIAIFLLYKSHNFIFKNVILILLIFTSIFFYFKYLYLNKIIPNDDLVKDSGNFSLKSTLNSLYIYCIPFVAWGITGWLQSNSEKWVILNYLNTKEVGIFSLLTVIANYLIATPIGILNQFIQPILFNKISNKSITYSLTQTILFNKYLILLISIITSSAFIITFLFEKQIIKIIANESFITEKRVLPFICLSIGIFNLAQILANIGIVVKKPKIYIWPKIILGILSLILNIIFIIYFGLIGIVYGLMISNSLYLYFMYKVNRKILRLV